MALHANVVTSIICIKTEPHIKSECLCLETNNSYKLLNKKAVLISLHGILAHYGASIGHLLKENQITGQQYLSGISVMNSYTVNFNLPLKF